MSTYDSGGFHWDDAKERTATMICAALAVLAMVGMYFMMR